jgi:hypothetical protein
MLLTAPLAWTHALSRGSIQRLSIKSKLILMLLLASGFSTLVTATLGYRSGQQNLSQRVFNQLTSVRASKAYQIESYFRNIQHHTQTLSEGLSIIAAAEQFDAAFQALNKAGARAEVPAALATYYRNEFLPRLGHGDRGTPVLPAYLPKEPAARRLQTQYIATNPHPVGKKQRLVAATDNSAYSQAHRQYHPVFRNIVAKFGYYDMFLLTLKGRLSTRYSRRLTSEPASKSGRIRTAILPGSCDR